MMTPHILRQIAVSVCIHADKKKNKVEVRLIFVATDVEALRERDVRRPVRQEPVHIDRRQ